METKKKQSISPAQFCLGPSEADGVRELMTTIGDKWSILLIVCLVKKTPGYRARFSELGREIPDISQKMLSATLKKLEHDGFVIREVFPEIPPRVEYELTPLGLRLFTLAQGIVSWVSDNWSEVLQARRCYEDGQDKNGIPRTT